MCSRPGSSMRAIAPALVLLLSFSALAQAASADASVMTITIVEGAATVSRGGQPPTEPLAEGAALHEGDVVQTGPAGRLEILLANGSHLRVGPSARVALKQAGRERTSFSARVLFGSVWAKVTKLLANESFQVETDNGVAGVRGTEFLVEAGAQGKDDHVRVYEGAVAVREHAGQWEHRVEPGRELSFRHGLRPVAPHAFDLAADRAHPLMKWVRERPPAAAPQRPGPQKAPGQQKAPEPQKAPEQHKKEKEKKEKRRWRMFERLQYRR